MTRSGRARRKTAEPSSPELLPRESWASTAAARKTMQANRSRDTKPELAVRRAVHALGLRYRVQARPLPEARIHGDIVFPRCRVVVFIDGCYWHGCPQHHRLPRTNSEYWTTKIARNIQRDQDTNRLLAESGWLAIRIWEHEDPDLAAQRIARSVRSRRALCEVRRHQGKSNFAAKDAAKPLTAEAYDGCSRGHGPLPGFQEEPRVFPTCEPFGSIELPPSATFWTPKRSELDDEGFGFFRDVWTIIDVPVRDARHLVSEEQAIAAVIGELASDEENFDRLAYAVECGDDEGDKSALMPHECAALASFLADDEPAPLEGLELGVAGLTYALSAVGMFPAASCRGHTGSKPWSEAPVVLFAADRFHAEKLQPLASDSGCRFDLDSARPDLLVVRGCSVLDTMRLAGKIIDLRDQFKRPPRQRRQRPSGRYEQLSLFYNPTALGDAEV